MTTGNAGNLVALFKIDSTGAQASMTAAEITTAKALESMKRQFMMVSARVKELEGGAKSLNTNLSMAKATQEVRNFGQAAELSSKQLARANQMLPAQISDIAVSLAGGQALWMVALQQGSQIKDSYGGVGNAAQMLVQSLNPLNIALGASAAVGGVVAVGFIQGRKEMTEYQRQVLVTGGAADVTANQLNGMAAALEATTSATRGKSAEVLSMLVAGGGTSRAQLLQVTEATIAAERSLGMEAEKTAKAFASLGNEPLSASVKLNEMQNFLTISTYKQIKALTDQKREAEAGAVAQEAYAGALIARAKEIEGNLGTIEKSWRGVGDAAKWAWDKMLGLGRDESMQEKLQRVVDAQKDAGKTGWWDLRTESQRKGQMSDLKDSEDAIREQMRMAQRAASARSTEAAAVRAMAEADKKRVEKKPEQATGLMTIFTNEDAFNAWAAVENENEALKAITKAREDAWSIEKKNIEQMYRDEAELRDKEIAAAKKHQAELAKHGQDQVKSFEDGVMILVTKGKAGFADLFNTMREEFIRNLIRMAAQKTMLDSNGAFVGWGQTITNIGNWAGGAMVPSGFANGYAGGLDYVPYDGYPAILHKGERVQRAVEANTARSSDGRGTVQQVDNRVIVQGDVGAKALRAIRMGQNMQAARMANAERY